MAQKGVRVIAVEPGSLAARAGIQAGDTLLEINGEPVLDQLRLLAGPDAGALQMVENYQLRIRQKHRREKYSLVLILAATLLLCLLIWLAGR